MRKNKIVWSILLIVVAIVGIIIINSCQKESTIENLQTKSAIYFVTKQEASSYSCVLTNSFRIQMLKSANINKSMTKKKVKDISSIPDDNNIPAFYIINYEEGGFILLSADKRVSPIFGFSECNNFPQQSELRPPALELMLTTLKDKIMLVRKNNPSATKLVQQEWNNLETNSLGSQTMNIIQPPPDPTGCVDIYEQGGPLLSTQWGQGIPYNSYLPSKLAACGTYDNFKAGCTTVAMAQVMKYYQKPTSYNWSLIIDGAQATARLISNMDSIMHPEYLCGGTKLDVSVAPGYLKNSFGFSSADYSGYDYSTVLSELSINRPVILEGNDGYNHGTWVEPRYEGHTWVADGFIHNIICMYDNYGVFIGTASYLYFHMNWGYDGSGDGYFGFDNFNPIVEGEQIYCNNQRRMVYNIRP